MNAILAFFTVAAIMGAEPPELVAPFPTLDDCMIEAERIAKVQAAELAKAKVAVACLKVHVPTI